MSDKALLTIAAAIIYAATDLDKEKLETFEAAVYDAYDICQAVNKILKDIEQDGLTI